MKERVGFFLKNQRLKMRYDLLGHNHGTADHDHLTGTEGKLLVAVSIAIIGMGGEVMVVDKFEKRDFAVAADPVFAVMLHQHRKLEQLLQGRLR